MQNENTSPKTDPKAKASPKKSPAVEPRFIPRGSLTFRHDLFDGQPAKMLKNRSWKKAQPDLTEVAHQHFFHSTDMRGNPQKHTTAQGGHFHEVIEQGIAADGTPFVKVGPPLQKIQRRVNGFMKSFIEPVQFPDASSGKVHVDSHTHAFTYVGSEMLSPEIISQQRAEGAKAMKALGWTPGDVKDDTPRESADLEDGGEE